MAHTDTSNAAEGEAVFADNPSSTVANGDTSTVMPVVAAATTVSSPRAGTGPVLNPQGAD